MNKTERREYLKGFGTAAAVLPGCSRRDIGEAFRWFLSPAAELYALGDPWTQGYVDGLTSAFGA